MTIQEQVYSPNEGPESLSEQRAFALVEYLLLPDTAAEETRDAARVRLMEIGGSDPETLRIAHEVIRLQHTQERIR